MIFEWDEKKRTINLQRHGFDFADAAEVFGSETTTIEDDRFDYGEIRFVTFGMLQGLVVAIVYTESDENIRVISFRRATRNEEREYYEKIRN
ncbi:MAG: BrnT family toxin [Saprospiraceae bacterium]|nr:BrnT family toxin [Pyrinomonadaceae bacterium]